MGKLCQNQAERRVVWPIRRVHSCSKQPKSGWTTGSHREEGKRTYSDSLSWKTFIVLHFVVHMKNDKNSCVKDQEGELREKLGSFLLSHLHTAGLTKASVNVGSLVSKTYRCGWTQPPSPMSERCQGRGFLKLFSHMTSTFGGAYRLLIAVLCLLCSV